MLRRSKFSHCEICDCAGGFARFIYLFARRIFSNAQKLVVSFYKAGITMRSNLADISWACLGLQQTASFEVEKSAA